MGERTRVYKCRDLDQMGLKGLLAQKSCLKLELEKKGLEES